MAIKILSTADFSSGNGWKGVVYGGPGIGKTSLVKTADKSIILSAEKGLLSLKKFDFPYIEIKTPNDIDEAYNWLCSAKAKEFKTIFLDTVSEVSEVLLSDFLINGDDIIKGPLKDARQGYRMMAQAMMPMIRKYRDIPGKNVIFLAKLEVKEDENTGILHHRPMIPGNVVKNQLPYMFDGVFLYDQIKDKDKNDVRVFQTGNSIGKVGKDRSGNLSFYEKPEIDYIISKSLGD